MKELCSEAPVTTQSLGAYVDGIKGLPPTPTVLIKLIEMFRQPDADVDSIVQLLRRDPALSAEVLRRCNTSFFGSGSTVKDVNEAVYRLGFYEVYQITVSLFGMRALTSSSLVPEFPAEKLRRHSSIAAIAAGALARDVGVPEGIAFTAALLHDVGKLAFALAEQDRYVALIDQCNRTGESLSKLEEKSFGFDHSKVGAQLLRHWGVPEELVLPVLDHTNSTASTEEARLTLLTHSGSELANHIAGENSGAFSATPPGEQMMNSFGMGTNDIDGWEHLVRSKVRQLDSLSSPQCPTS
jgi:putative nucleotidyltransferase with HDIG domain